MKSWDKAALPWLIVGVVAIAAYGASRKDKEAPKPQPAPVSAVEPVSDQCRQLVKIGEETGAMRAGGMTRNGATIIVSQRWGALPFSDQQAMAECASHVMAGGQNRWIKRIQFRNQVTGVTYGTIENTRYRVGE